MPDLKSKVADKKNDTDQQVFSLYLMTHYEFRPITSDTCTFNVIICIYYVSSKLYDWCYAEFMYPISIKSLKVRGDLFD